MYSGNSLAPDKGNRGFIHWDVSFIGLTLNNCKLNHIFLNQRFWPLSYQTRMSGWLLKEVFNQNLILWNPLLSSKIFSETQVEQAGPQRRKKMGIAGAEAESLQIRNKRLYEWGEWGKFFLQDHVRNWCNLIFTNIFGSLSENAISLSCLLELTMAKCRTKRLVYCHKCWFTAEERNLNIFCWHLNK